MTFQALIFDVDGTLAETEEAHRRAFNEPFGGFGLDWHWDRAVYADLLTVTGGKERGSRISPQCNNGMNKEKLCRMLK